MPRQNVKKTQKEKEPAMKAPMASPAPEPVAWVPAPALQPVAQAPSPASFTKGRERVLLGALLLVILLGVALWQLNGWSGTAAPANGANNSLTNATVKLAPTLQPQGQLLLALVNKSAALPTNYHVLMVETSSQNAMPIELTASGSERSGRLETPVYNRTYVWLNNRTLLCEQPLENTAACTAINDSLINGTTLADEARHLQDLFYPQVNETAAVIAAYQSLMKEPTFGFDGNGTQGQVAGRPCREIAYHLGDARLQVCLDEQYGIVLRQNMTYDQPYKNTDGTIGYQKANYRLEIGSLDFGAQSVAAPGENVSLEQMRGAVLLDAKELGDLQTCQLGRDDGERNRCYKNNAISYDQVYFCSMSTNESAIGDCVIKVATQPNQLRPELCERAGAMKSDCYANVAYLKQDSSYCAYVENATLHAQCIQMTGPQNATGTSNGTSGVKGSAGASAPAMNATTNSTSGAKQTGSGAGTTEPVKSSATNSSAPSYSPNYGRPTGNATSGRAAG